MALSDAEIEQIARERLGQSAQPQSSGLPDSEIERIARERLAAEQPESNYQMLAGGARQALQGLTANTSDEIEGVANAAMAVPYDIGAGIYNALGGDAEYVNPVDAYATGRDEARRSAKDFAERRPITSTALNIAGSLPTIALMPEINGIGSAMKVGGLTGAAYGAGAGEGGLENRIVSGVGGGIAGAAIGGAVNAASQGIGAIAKTEPVRKIAEYLQGKLGDTSIAGQRGMAGVRRGASIEAADPELTPAQSMIAKALLGKSDDALEAARLTQEGAVAGDEPMFLAESFGLKGNRPAAPKLQRLAKTVANSEGGSETAFNAIGDRADAINERLTGTFDQFMPMQEGANQKGVTAAQRIINDKIKERSLAAKPMYDRLRGHEFEDTGRLFKNTRVQEAIDEVRKAYPELEKLPDNSFDVMNEARRYLYDQSKKSERAGDNWLKKLYGDAREKMTDVMDMERPDYFTTRKSFESGSHELEKMKDGPLGMLADLAEGNVQSAGKRMFALKPNEIAELKAQMPEGAFRGMVRSHLQDIVENQQDGFNKVRKLVGVPRNRAILEEALNPDEAAKLIKSLKNEDTFARYTQMYHYGSDTAANLADKGALEKGGGTLRAMASLLGGNKLTIGMDAFKNLLQGTSTRGDRGLEQELAKILFDPNASKQTLDAIAPFLKKANQHYGNVDWWTTAASRGGTQTGAVLGGNRTK